ncbi:MAG: hypothetical protein HYZ27_10690 [Deltaproteobacteria bacterium]|nr:hypothetical protein [Deltaproteobacteria bacterium]
MGSWVRALPLAGLLVAACTTSSTGGAAHHQVPELELTVPDLAGWVVDKNVRLTDPAKGGLAFRLVREGAVAGSPRVEVFVEPLKTRPTVIEDFLTENLREMGRHERDGKILITRVDQEAMHIGPRRAFKLRHAYTLGKGSAQAAVTQVSVLFVLNGRGVAVTAAGVTELFYPLADSIEQIMNGLSLPMRKEPAPQQSTAPVPTTPPASSPQPATPPALQPIDLGRIGGR